MKYKLRKEEEKRNDEIIKELPTFINQLLLLLNSGMVLQEALETVALRYGALSQERKNFFTEQVHALYVKSQKNGENFLTGFCLFGRESRIKELSRLAGILTDGSRRGTELWDRLAEESEELWAERKRRAMERIRLAESKMSFPLALLLTALVIITAAPAMMQMYIN